ncbi:MAG: hypothetical protein K2L42_02365 [Clostridia bacterium]|nr:hypothetical protein [Clostridia bacterium]
MAGYTKNIAVIRGIKDGFSADGGELSGLVKAEKYGAYLTVEISFINFAPLSEGGYVTALTDGNTTVFIDGESYEGATELDTAKGFAALICFVNGQVYPVASAVCGNFRGEVLALKAETEKRENLKAAHKPPEKKQAEQNENAAYEDEAIAEDNYYEYEADENGGSVREDKKEKEERNKPDEDEAAVSAFEKEQIRPDGKSTIKNPESEAYYGGNTEEPLFNPLAGGDFYEKMKTEIEGILQGYPKEECLERLIENSRWVRISYTKTDYYVFGVIYSGGKAQYICYGVPAADVQAPPESMKDSASFIPSSADGAQSGFWVMYQDAQTGATLKADFE